MPIDYKAALKWIELSAEAGNVVGMINLGFMYYSGHGVPKDGKRALEWTFAAGRQGHPQAYFNLGCFYRDGVGTAKDAVVAYAWFTRAAAGGIANAQYKAELVAANMSPEELERAKRLAAIPLSVQKPGNK